VLGSNHGLVQLRRRQAEVIRVRPNRDVLRAVVWELNVARVVCVRVCVHLGAQEHRLGAHQGVSATGEPHRQGRILRVHVVAVAEEEPGQGYARHLWAQVVPCKVLDVVELPQGEGGAKYADELVGDGGVAVSGTRPWCFILQRDVRRPW
jgi:hypothetical protein